MEKLEKNEKKTKMSKIRFSYLKKGFHKIPRRMQILGSRGSVHTSPRCEVLRYGAAADGLRVVVMSATIDAARLEDAVGNIPGGAPAPPPDPPEKKDQ